LVKTAHGADEAREYRKLEISFVALAANAQWMVDNQDMTVRRTLAPQEKDYNDSPAP